MRIIPTIVSLTVLFTALAAPLGAAEPVVKLPPLVVVEARVELPKVEVGKIAAPALPRVNVKRAFVGRPRGWMVRS